MCPKFHDIHEPILIQASNEVGGFADMDNNNKLVSLLLVWVAFKPVDEMGSAQTNNYLITDTGHAVIKTPFRVNIIM